MNPAVVATKPFFFVNRQAGLSVVDADAGYDEAACRASSASIPVPVGTVGDVVTLAASFDGWGYVHLFRNGTGKLAGAGHLRGADRHGPGVRDRLRQPVGA